MVSFDTVTTSLISRLFKAVVEGKRIVKTFFFIAIILILVAFGIAALADRGVISKGYSIVAGIMGLIAGIIILGIYAYQTNIEESEAKEEIKKVEEKAKDNPNEPAAAWELARIKLENYLNRNLTQIHWIFIWTVVTMIAGFVIIGYGIVKAYSPTTHLNASLLTSVTGLLVEFIGVTFLIIYKSTMQQAKEYVNVLERINAVGMSVQILERISKEETKLQDQTRAEIAKQLLALYGIKT